MEYCGGKRKWDRGDILRIRQDEIRGSRENENRKKNHISEKNELRINFQENTNLLRH